jgi:C-terminal processing protease CtpA/Prc
MWDWIEDQLVISYVDDSLDDLLKLGDVVTSIDGDDALESVKRVESLVSTSTPQWARFAALERLRQRSGDRGASLTVRRGEQTLSVEIKATVPATEAEDWTREPRPPKIATLSDGVVYADLTRATKEELKKDLERLSTAEVLILDMRGYPLSAFEILPHLIKERRHSPTYREPVLVRPDFVAPAYITASFAREPEPPYLAGKKMFLTDAGAVSAGETFLSYVEAYALGEILGSPTAGTNGNTTTLTTPGGYAIRLTGMKVVRSDGKSHHGRGIAPTHPVSRTIAGVRDGRDEVLSAALKMAAQYQRKSGKE